MGEVCPWQEAVGVSRKKKNYFDACEYTNRLIEERARRALKERSRRNSEFAHLNLYKPDAWLLNYLREQAAELGHTPVKGEIIGGEMIARRFGGWPNALAKAGLPEPPQDNHRRSPLEEEKLRQAKLLRQEKKEAQAKREAEKEERAKAAAEEKELRSRQETTWAEAHRDDTDGELIAYVRECADSLGRTPFAREVLGSEYIRQRIGGWPEVLALAGLPLPKGMRQPIESKLREYHRRNSDVSFPLRQQ